MKRLRMHVMIILIQSLLLKISVSVYKSFLIDRHFFIILSIEKTRRYDIIIQRQIGICRLIFHQSLYFQGIFAVKCQILMFCPCFCPYQPKQGQILYCPTTISSSFADFFFASLVAWAYTFIVVLTSECPRSSCTSFGCAPFSNRFVV